MNANDTKPKASPEAGALILGTLHGAFNSQAEIRTTELIRWSPSMQRYYVTGYRLIKSKQQFSKNELQFCLIDFEKVNK